MVYTYAPGREHTHAHALLGAYSGILQCDGYDAYKKVARPKSIGSWITLVFCRRAREVCGGSVLVSPDRKLER